MVRSNDEKEHSSGHREIEKLTKLPKGTIHKRPLIRPVLPSPFSSAAHQKTVYVGTKTPFMSAFKRVQKLLDHIEKREMQSTLAKQTKGGKVKLRNEVVESGKGETVQVKASGKAIEKALGLGLFMQGIERYSVQVGTESVDAIDDIIMDDCEPREEEADLPEARIRKANMIVIEVTLKHSADTALQSDIAAFDGQERARVDGKKDNAVVIVSSLSTPDPPIYGEQTALSKLTTRETILPLTIVLMVFCIGGFHGGFSDVLGKRFQDVLGLTKKEVAGLHGAYYSAFLLGPLTYGRWSLRRFGYRKTFILALSLYALGAILYWPASVLRRFWIYCFAQFILASGLATLGTAGLPYIAICGSSRWSEMRLNIVLAFELTFVLSALLMGSYVVFDEETEADGSLEPVKWIYITLSCAACVLLALLCSSIRFPELSDEDMGAEAKRTAEDTGWIDRPLRRQDMLFYGVAAVFCYTGAQASLSAYFINFLREIEPTLSNAAATHRMAIAIGVFTISRFAIAGIMRFVKPRRVLVVAMTCTATLIATLIAVRGTTGVALLILAWVSKAPIYPTMFTISLRGLGRHTKTGGSLLTAAICGGAVFSPAFGALADAKSTQLAMVVPLTGTVLAWSFAVYINVCKKRELDGYRLVKCRDARNVPESGDGEVKGREGLSLRRPGPV
ncbi:MAG: hypothetical protein M1828_000918 [Chrysothrix sp. TS-e1954]|nr:MAG: hypothetical protein M1828_000918 [Chrysothrix sp. TS-e1954]